MVDLAEYNPFSMSSGSSLLGGSTSFILLIFAVVVIFLIIGGLILYYVLNMKKYYIIIELYKRVDGRTKHIKKVRACEFKIGKAGDLLWYVSGYKKYIMPGTIESGANTFKYFMRSDGEWINFEIGDIEEQMRKANVKFVHNDMRAQRIAISKSLDAELKEDSFWNKYGATITFIIEILVFGVACVIIFYMFGKTVSQMDLVVGKMDSLMLNMQQFYGNVSKDAVFIIPNMIALLFTQGGNKNVRKKE